MARPLSAAAWIERFHAKGATYRQIAEGLNRSVSTVYAIRKGRNSGETVRPAAKQLAQRRAPDPRAHIVPVPKAPAPAPRPTPPVPGEVRAIRPGVTHTYLSPTRRATTFDHIPTNAEILRELGGKTPKEVQLVITFTDGKVARLLTHGWSHERMRRILEAAEEEWLLAFLEKERGYRGRGPNPSHGGISSVQVVIY